MKRLARMLAVVVALGLAVPAVATSETWVIDPVRTVSGFTARHMMVTNVTGAFEVTKGAIDYKPGDPSSLKADVIIEAKTVNTRIARRDDDLRSERFFDVEKFPALRFKSKRVRNVRPDGFDLIGDLTIRDVTKEVVLRVEGPTPALTDGQGNRRIGAMATTTINRKDFGINWSRAIEAGGAVVSDEVKITIDVEAVEQRA
jgi:polyisoprenoid-binding protein YceI